MTQPQSSSPPPPRPNHRASRRYPPKRSTRVRATRNSLGLGPNIALAVLDLSETGIRLLLGENLRRGQEFEVVLESAGSRPVKVVAGVVWSVGTAEGQFCVGARFQKLIGYADVQALTRL